MDEEVLLENFGFNIPSNYNCSQTKNMSSIFWSFQVGIFVDYQNFSISSYEKGLKPDLCPIRDLGKEIGNIAIQNVYMDKTVRNLILKEIRSLGYQPIVCQANHFKTNIDATMIADLLDLDVVQCIDYYIIVSGDGDFVPAIRKLKKYGKFVHVIYPSIEVLSINLREVADLITDYSFLVREKNTN